PAGGIRAEDGGEIHCRRGNEQQSVLVAKLGGQLDVAARIALFLDWRESPTLVVVQHRPRARWEDALSQVGCQLRRALVVGDLGYLLSGVGVPWAQGSGTVTSPCSCSKRCHVSNVKQNLPPTPEPGPQLFQNHTSLLPASIWSATTSWPPRTVAPLATATSPDASGVSKLEYQPIPVMTGRRTSARSACSTPNACLYDVIQPSCLAALQTSSPLPPGS